MKHLLLVALCLGLLGSEANSWQYAPSDEVANRLFRHEVSSGQYCVVSSAYKKIAINRLQNNTIVALSKRVAENYATPCKFELKRFVYLVRALDVSWHDQFAVYEDHGNLYVTSGVLGTSATPHRTALVLSTKFAVSKVYVNYFVAQ